ncbi:hypothetical protein [Streptomyces liliifuscus]|uniref:Uncharacterized protein n=1 Tax=Streptomyces liliifuscus TaxID=2797636 RepID=A0A7T7KY10_9ACTN|nr:hypothetical protein [Streptomyces liliifuscus]QQM42813.1 hypothetical protein JEQ17_27585 [Streptomyces liliifuscus]
MTTQQTAPEPPVSLPDPTRPPRPAPGCDVCATLERDRIRFERAGNVKAATTCEVEMRNHPKHTEGAS